jgi:hypothetical protein
MDLKTAMVLAKRHLAPTVVVILMLVGGMVYVWGEYKEVVKQRNQLTDREIALSERKAELDKREFIVQQREKDYQEQLSSFQHRVAEYGVASAKLRQEQAALSEAQRIKTAEEKIQLLMSEFSALGVDLNRQPCNGSDAEAQARYNAAQIKYSEINALSEAYRLKDRYNSFLLRNRQTTSNFRRHCPWEFLAIGAAEVKR